jgi:hypothetical protein
MPSFVQFAHSRLAQLAADGADIPRIIDRAVAMWRDIEVALKPIIGRRGVAALFKRSLFLTGAGHASLLATLDDVDAVDSVAALRATLEQQPGAAAIATNDALLQAFSDLLINLIGESLTERLLQPVQDNPSSDSALREESK